MNLDSHGEMLMRQFRELRPKLEQLASEAYNLLHQALNEQGIYVTGIEYRVKTEKSLAGKLELKGAKYKSIDDITDLVGLRVITFYTDEVDKVAAIAKRMFDIDWQESVDKRKLHQLDAFGYNSLHYICRLKEPLSSKQPNDQTTNTPLRTTNAHSAATCVVNNRTRYRLQGRRKDSQ